AECLACLRLAGAARIPGADPALLDLRTASELGALDSLQWLDGAGGGAAELAHWCHLGAAGTQAGIATDADSPAVAQVAGTGGWYAGVGGTQEMKGKNAV